MSPEPGYYVIRQATVGDPHGDSAAPMYMADNGIGLKMTAKKLDTNPDKVRGSSCSVNPRFYTIHCVKVVGSAN